MTESRDFDRLARAWLDLMPDEAPDRVIESVLQAAATMPQLRPPSHAPLRRFPTMNRLTFAAVAMLVIVVAIGGAIALNQYHGANTGAPSPLGSSASPPPAASGGPAPSPLAVQCSDPFLPKIGGQTLDLSGVYSWSLGTFYVQQFGACVYLMGQSNADANGPPGKGFTSIFIGSIDASSHLVGFWSDIPYGTVGGHGTIDWRIDATGPNPVLTVVNSTGGWGATELVRAGPAPS